MLVRTSVEGILKPGATARSALLADFDIDGSDLKRAHTDFLDSLVEVFRRSPLRPPLGTWIVHVKGQASKSGGNKHNAILSDMRAKAVQNYLSARSPMLVFNTQAVGEEFPRDPLDDENALDRSVEVAAFPRVNIEPPPPRRPPVPDRAKTKVFDLRVTGFHAGFFPTPGVRIAHWLVNLEISEQGTDFPTAYVFNGWGSSGGIFKRCRSSRAGIMQSFRAHRRFDEDSFEGDAAFTFAGEKGLFRFGGSKFLLGLDAFPKGRIEDFVLPPAIDARPTICAASGKLKFGVGDLGPPRRPEDKEP